MGVLNVVGSSVFQILSIIFVLCYLLGVLNLHFSGRTNYCHMTYMYEYPQFVRLSLPENQEYPQYGLYAYSEGRFTERARKMWFDGIPVLFLPGNSGSHMQARSIASVALRKAISYGYQYHFDYFTVSYNGELSALYGGVLQSQTKFAAACVTKILSLYKANKYTKTVPTTVILIGHSMGGVIAKRLLAYPSTLNTTTVAITLAAPLEAPVINTDPAMDDYYMLMNFEWETHVNSNPAVKKKKILISVGNGPRDLLVPAGLTSSNDSYISALTTAIPGVWLSPDHVAIVWCKQLVLVINRYLFSIIDTNAQQIVNDTEMLMTNARHYFQANRSMTLINPEAKRPNLTMIADAFWYEDNRRIYQISRPQIDKTTYLMIRLVTFPQNRFVAVEAVNVEDTEWIFGCNARHAYNNYRYCKHATSLLELSHWTGAANDFGKRKLATINLHTIKDDHPDWTHVIVKVSPTKKPIVLNVDISDYASRQITINVPSEYSLSRTIIKQQTEEDSIYYEIILKDFNLIHQAYLLYVEPVCKTAQYHASAELHVPWAQNHEYYHYFTHLKETPMKLRLYKSNPNVTKGLDTTEYAKVILILDPKCTYTISISPTWYHHLAQLARNYSPVLLPYIAAIILLATRSNLLHLKSKGRCVSMHRSLMSEGVKPYYALVCARLAATVLVSVPMLSFVFDNASWRNIELQYFTRSLLVLPAYMTALGIVNIIAAVLLGVMVFSSQIAHRMLFRIMWRGGSGLAEKVAAGLQKVPMVVSAGLICAVPLSCGAAALVAGAAFYGFLLSKMYEEYLEDYVYKLLAKVASRMCRIFKRNKKTESETSLVNSKENTESTKETEDITKENNETEDGNKLVPLDSSEKKSEPCITRKVRDNEKDVDEDLSSLNFHMMMFCMWLVVTLVNVPALLTWARNFSHSMVLKPDTSYHTGLLMAACSTCVWQINGPRRNLRHHEAVTALLFTMSVFILALGPLSLAVVNYGVAFMFTVITVQQVCDIEDTVATDEGSDNGGDESVKSGSENEQNSDEKTNESDKNGEKSDGNGENSGGNRGKSDGNGEKSDSKPSEDKSEQSKATEQPDDDDPCNVCNENRIYNVFKNIRDKFSFTEDL